MRPELAFRYATFSTRAVRVKAGVEGRKLPVVHWWIVLYIVESAASHARYSRLCALREGWMGAVQHEGQTGPAGSGSA
jgi:hypothetical protein